MPHPKVSAPSAPFGVPAPGGAFLLVEFFQFFFRILVTSHPADDLASGGPRVSALVHTTMDGADYFRFVHGKRLLKNTTPWQGCRKCASIRLSA